MASSWIKNNESEWKSGKKIWLKYKYWKVGFYEEEIEWMTKHKLKIKKKKHRRDQSRNK